MVGVIVELIVQFAGRDKPCTGKEVERDVLMCVWEEKKLVVVWARNTQLIEPLSLSMLDTEPGVSEGKCAPLNNILVLVVGGLPIAMVFSLLLLKTS